VQAALQRQAISLDTVVEAQFESGFKGVGLPLWMIDSWEMHCISSCTAHLLHMQLAHKRRQHMHGTLAMQYAL
jgi:hypothetical protein